MDTIIVKEITPTALSVASGIKVRDKIIEIFDNGGCAVELDFTDISVFTTMFFNACYGYFFKKYRSIDDVVDRIKYKNLTSLGIDTLNHSMENAKIVLSNEDNIRNITENNLSES